MGQPFLVPAICLLLVKPTRGDTVVLVKDGKESRIDRAIVLSENEGVVWVRQENKRNVKEESKRSSAQSITVTRSTPVERKELLTSMGMVTLTHPKQDTLALSAPYLQWGPPDGYFSLGDTHGPAGIPIVPKGGEYQQIPLDSIKTVELGNGRDASLSLANGALVQGQLSMDAMNNVEYELLICGVAISGESECRRFRGPSRMEFSPPK